ncbi:MAG: hypothetical protein PHS57_01205 [Alphaproteobacteria bacterium]|nr:hypothetical protein [Alphaproteobacteria bacterium]
MSLQDSYCALETLPATFAEGASLSAPINLHGLRLFGLALPSEWTEASITFQTSADDGSTWADMQTQDGNELSAVATAGNCTVLDPLPFAAAQHLRLRSGSSSAPVAQEAARTLRLILRSV